MQSTSLPNTKPPESDLFRRPLLFYFRQHKKNFLLGLLSLLITNSLDALPPLFIGKAIDQMAENAELPVLLRTILFLIVTISCLAVFRYFWRIFWGRFHHAAAADLRNRIFDKFTELGPSFFQKRPIGNLMTLINNDVNYFRMAIGPGMLVFFDALFLFFILPPLMISLSPSWTWKTLILMPFIPFVINKILRTVHRNYKVQQNRFAEMSGSSQEIISGIRVIKSYAQEKNQVSLFNVFSRNYELAANQVAKVDSYFTPTMEIGITIGSVILLFIGAPEVISGAVSVGSFFAFYQYIQRMVWPMTALGIAFSHVQQGRASFDRILELLRTESDIADRGELNLTTFENLEVKNLSFKYPGEEREVLKNISFHLRKGEILGVTGATGSGKSTLVDLLLRQFPTGDGQIQINGHPLQTIASLSLRRLISFVPQDTFVFSRKISENVALGREDWQIEDVKSVCQLVNIHDEIEEMPQAYESYLGEKGVNLSGGQKQRLTLARALIRQAPLMIFDDSLSAIDARTEKSILENLKSNLRGQENLSAIVVSHRIGSLRWANRILVLNKGEIEAIGTHEELLSSSPTYHELCQLQSHLSEDESEAAHV